MRIHCGLIVLLGKFSIKRNAFLDLPLKHKWSEMSANAPEFLKFFHIEPIECKYQQKSFLCFSTSGLVLFLQTSI